MSDPTLTTEMVMLRFPREGYFTPIPARREWEKANGKRLQAINRYIDRDEVVIVYEVIP